MGREGFPLSGLPMPQQRADWLPLQNVSGGNVTAQLRLLITALPQLFLVSNVRGP